MVSNLGGEGEVVERGQLNQTLCQTLCFTLPDCLPARHVRHCFTGVRKSEGF